MLIVHQFSSYQTQVAVKWRGRLTCPPLPLPPRLRWTLHSHSPPPKASPRQGHCRSDDATVQRGTVIKGAPPLSREL